MANDDAVQEVKRRVDLAHVVGRYVKLKRQGKSFLGLCPFHQEKTPSFNVHPDEGFFKCFGCDAKGDVFSFLERQTGQSFIEILKGLAEETGVALEERSESPEQSRRRRERKRVLQVLQLAQTWFRGRLTGEDGKLARAYLKDARQVPAEQMEGFALGFGGQRDDGLVRLLESEGVTKEEALLAGVVAEKDRGPYDFFRQRLLFPIRDTRGEVVSFSGRAFGPGSEDRPKYVNGPASPVYDKSRVLYGLFESLPALKRGKPGVLVEGQLDVLAVHRVGVPSAFAPCGTSLTEGHLQELKRYTERVVVCMDADAAGRAASERAILLFLRAGFDVSLASLLEKDPDEMVRAGEGEALRAGIEGAPAALDALIERAALEGAGSSRDRVRAVDKLLPFLAAPPRELTRRQYARAAAAALQEDERVLWTEVEGRGKEDANRLAKQHASLQARAAPRQEAPPEDESEKALRPRPAKAAPRQVKWKDTETLLAQAVLSHPLLAPRCNVLMDDLRNPELKRLLQALIDALVRFHDLPPQDLLPKVAVPNTVTLVSIIKQMHQGTAGQLDRFMTVHAANAAIDDFLRSYDARPLEERLRQVSRAIVEVNEGQDLDQFRRLQNEKRALMTAMRMQQRPGELPAPAATPLLPAAAPPTPTQLEGLVAVKDDEDKAAPPPTPSPTAEDDPSLDEDAAYWDDPV
jgi:DNA primase